MDNNSDGFGYMYIAGDHVHITKGAMNPQEVEVMLKLLPQDIRDLPMALHFRVATHGSVSPENCHPYPVSADDSLLKTLELDCKTAIVHNGIIPHDYVDAKFTKKVWINGKKQQDDEDVLSDTAIFVKEFLAPMGKAMFNHIVAKMLGTVGKIAILDAKRGCTLIGGFTADNGRYYSNDTYKESTYGYVYHNGNHKGKYFEEDDDVYPNFMNGFATIEGMQFKYASWGECGFCHTVSALYHVNDEIGDLCWNCIRDYKEVLAEEREENRLAELLGDGNVNTPILSDQEKQKNYEKYRDEQKAQSFSLPMVREAYNKLGEKICNL